MENTVHLQAIYYPRNSSQKTKVLVNMEKATIEKSDIPDKESTSPYMFYLNREVPMDNLESGKIELIAYKNMRGNSVEDQVHRVFYVDNNRLYIDLVQPNIWTTDFLDTNKKVEYFNNNTPASGSGIELNNEGAFLLESTERVVVSDSYFISRNITDIIKTKEGDTYVLVNELNYLKIFRKSFGDNNWGKVLEKQKVHGYDLCETDLGILVGVSNLYSNDKSGLYLIQGEKLVDEKLINITIGKPIPHVQFINEDNGIISLYGNDFSNLYTFNIYSLEDNNGDLKAGISREYPFDNSYFIKDFHLTSNGRTAVIQTLENKIHFYTKGADNSFRPVLFHGGEIDNTKNYIKVVSGEYTDGDYNSFLLIEEDKKSPLVVMEHKDNHRFLINRNLEIDFLDDEKLIGTDFYRDLYTFVTYKEDSKEYRVRQRQILFNSIYNPMGSIDEDPFQVFNPGKDTSEIPDDNLSLFQADDSLFYSGYSKDSNKDSIGGLWSLRTEYPLSGDITFSYKNDDIEGLISFSFDIESSWIDSEYTKFGFALGESGSVNTAKTDTIKNLLEKVDDGFKVYRECNKDYGYTNLERITVVFDEMEEDKYLFFRFELKPVNGVSPEIHQLSITKKVPVKLPYKKNGQFTILPVHGYIYDPTVKTIKIDDNEVQVINGTFSDNIKIKNSEINKAKESVMEFVLECGNGNKESEKASLSFNVEFVESVNSISDVVLAKNNGTLLPETKETIKIDQDNILESNYYNTEEENILVSASYSGLIGAVTGYEICDIKNPDNIIRTGVFENKNISLGKEDNTDTKGIETGKIVDEVIKLYPDKQILKIYVENPGGYRSYFKTPYGDDFIVNYHLPLDQQGIELLNIEINTIEDNQIGILDGIDFDRKLPVTVYENSFNTFTKKVTLRGEVKSSYTVNDLKVKSFDPEITFLGNSDEIIVTVDSSGRFEVDFTIVLPEHMKDENSYDIYRTNYKIALIPTAPFLYELSRGVVVEAEKSFTNTNVIPVFEGYMSEDKWDSDEIHQLEKPVRVKIDRFIPENTEMTIIVNYEDEITGRLVEVNPESNEYRLLDGVEIVNLTGAKSGINRIQWWIRFDDQIISTSAARKNGMEDFLFNLSGNSEYKKTELDFTVVGQEYYTIDSLPEFTVTEKDENTNLEILLNEELIFKGSDSKSLESFILKDHNFVDGKNILRVDSIELGGNRETFNYDILFDSALPVVEISSYTYNSDKTQLESLTAMVTDYNLEDAVIQYKNISGVWSENNTDPVYEYIGNGCFKVFWDLKGISQPLSPSVSNPIKIRGDDHAGRFGESEEFRGIKSTISKPDNVDVIEINISNDEMYNDTPYFYYEENTSVSPFDPDKRVKFYSSSIGIEDSSFPDIFRIVRPDEIRLSSTDGSRDLKVANNSLDVEAGDKVAFYPGFSVNKGSEFTVKTGSDPTVDRIAEPLRFSHTGNLDSMSFAFYYRLEQNNIYNYDNGYKCILTLYEYEDDKKEVCESIYLASKNINEKDNNEVGLYLVGETGERDSDEESYDLIQKVIMDGSHLKISNSTENNNGWNLIVITVDKKTGSFTISLNDNIPLTSNNISMFYSNVYDPIMDPILGSDSINNVEHYFGSKEGDKNGHFSIAQPFYTSKAISIDEVPQLLSEIDDADDYKIIDTVNRRDYNFDAVDDDFGTDYFNLRSNLEPEDNSYYTTLENSDYKVAGNGALQASGKHINYLKVSNNLMVFSDSDKPYKYDITLENGDNSTTIKPLDNSTGRYFFSIKQGNHGLTNNKFYSVYGTVLDDGRVRIVDGKEVVSEDYPASIVLLIDGKEERIPLAKGDFHLVYDNSALKTPQSVKLYIETTKDITIKNNLVLTEGDYTLPPEAFNGLKPVKVTTMYPFSNAGTVDLWYKPMNINKEGFSSYPVTIFDSDFIRIYTQQGSKSEPAQFRAELKGGNNVNVDLASSFPVTRGWHNLQVSYSIPDQVAYFYVDGKIAFSYNDVINPSSSMISYSLDSNNDDDLAIGGNVNSDDYNADGYIDSVHLSRIYRELLYVDNNPVSFRFSQSKDNYKQPTAELDINNNFGLSADNIVYTLSSRDESFRMDKKPDSIIEHNFDMNSDISSGAYNLKASMEINGYRFDDQFSFIKNNRPNFTVSNVTPLIVNGVEGDINFEIRFDDSYLLQSIDGISPGFSLQIRGDRETNFENTVYIYKDLNDGSWIYEVEGSTDDPKTMDIENNAITFSFPGIISVKDIDWELKSFFFTNAFNISEYNFTDIADDRDGIIPIASLNIRKPDDSEIDYKLIVNVGNNNGDIDGELLKKLSIVTSAQPFDTISERGEDKVFNLKGTELHLYYDDILPDFGKYNCTVSLRYNNESFSSQKIDLDWKSTEEIHAQSTLKAKKLEITDFALLYLDRNSADGKVESKAKFYLEFEENRIENGPYYDLEVFSKINGEDSIPYGEKRKKVKVSGDSFQIIEAVDVPLGDFLIELFLYEIVEENGIEIQKPIRDTELEISNKSQAPEVVLTNTVPNRISYNNVLFDWKGTINGKNDSDIEFSYNVDKKDWTSYNTEWKSLELFNLDEGYHTFEVKAKYNDVESAIKSVPFFIDVNKPEFDSDKIEVYPYYDTEGIIRYVTITGKEGAVTDISLSSLFINGIDAKIDKDGSFDPVSIDLKIDGKNTIICSAFDDVGNISQFPIDVDNNITEILFPGSNNKILYAPATVIGKINKEITSEVEIFVSDPESGNIEDTDLSTWKKAKINSDRTFFIEDIYINPGTKNRETRTDLTLAVRTESGRIYTQNIPVTANVLTIPIEMKFSTHAVEGENTPTEVEISCVAHVENIASWSIDYTGDGIYDEIVTSSGYSDKKPDDDNENDDDKNKTIEPEKQVWKHTYSSLGLVSPRVRIITTDGNYFSVSDQIIIHEQITESSNLLVDNPLSLSSIRLEDGTDRAFLLAGSGDNQRIEVYEIGRNANYISDKLYSITGLKGMGIENASNILALDKTRLILSENRAGKGYVYLLEENEHGNIINKNEYSFSLSNPVKELEAQGDTLYISVTNSNFIGTVILEDMRPQPDSLDINRIYNPYLMEIGGNLSLAKENDLLIVADYSMNRILTVNSRFDITNYYDDFGSGEREFERPALVESTENRIFIFDELRKDIQIFDRNFNSVATLSYNSESSTNYLEENTLDDLKDISIVSRKEGNRLYYYALLISGSTNKLSMIRLPQWEELRASVHNNKIVFLKDKEIFTAKPDGSDLTRVLSSDSLPRIEGTLDYPAIAPDGRKIAFTSRVRLYNGSGNSMENSDQYAYDNLYMVDINGENLTRIPLGIINNFEIERPVFSSNGDKIIFSAKAAGGNWQIYIYNMVSGGISKLFNSDENARFPYYSPDDRFVVFTTDYDGDEEIVIADVENVNMRVGVTSNNCRDSYPVWTVLYPSEIDNPASDINSKIAFVSERNYSKSTYFTYVSQPSESDIRIVKDTDEETGGDPDSAAMKITADIDESDYPSFTGDGKSIVFEYLDDWKSGLLRYDFNDNESKVMNLPEDAGKPAGMKNMIVNFDTEFSNGDDLILTWSQYTDKDIFYTVQFEQKAQLDEEENLFVEKKFFTKDHAVLNDLVMGAEYLVRVCIIENNEEVATSLWKEVKMPEVAARATITVDEDNPYLVHLNAWKATEDTVWNYSWIIDNQEIPVQSTQDYLYEFSTSGTKTIVLKTYNTSKTKTSVSDPVSVKIVSDIIPVIEYVVDDGSTYVELSAENSPGERIDWSSAKWIVSGPGQTPLPPVTGSRVIVPLDIFKHKVNVNLVLTRIPVNGQSSTDSIEKNITIDLDFKDVKPVITYDINELDSRMFTFSGANSIGNIDWYNAVWTIFGDGVVLHQQNGKSSTSYRFGENGSEMTYTISLTVPRVSDGKSETTTQIVSVEPAPLEPVIDYEIITLEEKGDTVGAKVLFSCSNSKGNNIDFTNARWSVPVAGAYGEQPTQIGPTAIYNLFNAKSSSQVEVSLTLMRRGGTDIETITKMINVKPGDVTSPEIVVKKKTEKTSSGTSIIFDVLSSKGPNIDWEKTQWLLDGQYAKTGPVARMDLLSSGETQIVQYVCTLYRHGDEPIYDRGEVEVGSGKIKPLIDLSESLGNNVFKLTTERTEATNVDWTRTTWYIFDGNENVVTKRGANILHTFVPKSEAMGYPVMVEMFFLNDDTPFVGYKTIDIAGDQLKPVITWDLGSTDGDSNVVHFSAHASTGSAIDWSQVKWTFGDSSESQYGATVAHKYPVNGSAKSYKVSLTLLRTNTNGNSESVVEYKTISMGSDEIKPVIKAEIHNGEYLVLSAEDSEGRGLMLDRTSWLFEGEGDSSSKSVSTQTGKINNSSHSVNASVSAENTIGDFLGMCEVTLSASTGYGYSGSTTSYDDYKNSNESFSTSNSHVGATCRRYVGTQKRIVVTMFVYRVDPDGGMTGESITVNIDCEKAAMNGGISYE